MSWQAPGGEPPPDPADAPPDPADAPPDPADVPPDAEETLPDPIDPEPDTETARVPWEAAGASPLPPPAQPPATPPPATPPPAAPPADAAPVPPAPAPGGGSVLWASPTAPVAEIPGAPGLTFADTGSRFVAWLIDVILVGIVATFVAAAIGYGSAGSGRSAADQALLSVPYVLISLLYFVGFWTGGRRATIGQRLFDIQVGNAFDGKPLTLEQAIRRWLGYGSFVGLFSVLPGIGPLASLAEFIWDIALLITTAQSPTKQGLHDRFANTALVRPAGKTSSGIVKACLVIIVILVALALLSIVALIFLGSQVSDILRDYGNSI